jgi:hypothetical protein
MERGGISVDSLPRSGLHHGHPGSRSPPGTGMIGGPGPGSTGTGTGMFIPETYLEPSHSNNNSIASLRQKTGPGGRILEQHDSGVADVHLEGYRPSHTSISSSSSSPRGMNGFVMPQMGPNTGHHGNNVNKGLRPDSLAYTNEYEELPSAKYLDPNGKYSYANTDEIPPDPGLSPPPLHRSTLVNNSTENLCRGNTPDKQTNTYRRRQNPLYEDTNFGHSTGMKKSDEELESKKPDCFCPILIIVGILAFLTFLLVILLMTNTLPGSRKSEPEYALVVSNHSGLIKAMEALQEQYDALLIKVDRLERIIGPLENLNETSIDRGLITSLQIKFENMEQETQGKLLSLRRDITSNTQQMAALDRKLQNSESRTNRSIIAVQTDLQDRLASISTIPGPPGPQGQPGVGNLSLCEGRVKSNGGPSGFESTTTDWVPSDAAFVQDWVVMGATCSVEGGTLATLGYKTDDSLPDVRQYRCVCTGEMPDDTVRFCIMHYWVCPRIS